MSVINRMLKDLEVDQDVEVSRKGSILVSKKNNHLIIFGIIVTVFILFAFYFFWTKSSLKPVEEKSSAQQTSVVEKKTNLQSEAEIPLANTSKFDSSKVAGLSKKLPMKTIASKPKAIVKAKPVSEILNQNIQHENQKKSVVFAEPIKPKPEKIFNITKSKIDPKAQAQQLWMDAEKQPQHAEKLLNNALALDHQLHGARLQLIALLIAQKRLNDAERITDKGLIIAPTNADYIEWKARIRVANNDLKTGLQWLLKATPNIHQHVNYYGILASLASQLKYNDVAAETYSKLSKIQPKHGPWLLGMAISEERLGNFQSAKSYYQNALSADGLTPRARTFIQQKLKKLES